LKGRISYQASLLLTIISAALMANLRFSGLMKIIIPIVSFIYPALMVFAALHIATILKGLNPNYARAGFFLTLGFMSLSLVV
jgi:branched-subunit amino acid permease